jgi:hypothetical protein
MLEKILDKAKRYSLPLIASAYLIGCASNAKEEVKLSPPPEALFDSVYTREPITIVVRQHPGYGTASRDAFSELAISPDGILTNRSTNGRDPIKTSKEKIDSQFQSWIDTLQFYAKRINLEAIDNKEYDYALRADGSMVTIHDAGAIDLKFVVDKKEYDVKLGFLGAGTLELQKVQECIRSVIMCPSTKI